jgi:hypothetical protein
LNAETVAVYPNLPPQHWWHKFGQHKKLWDGGVIKLVYVGVLDTDTMYLEQVLRWVRQNQDNLELTIYCHQMTESAALLVTQYSGSNVYHKSAINYYYLPNELVNYDIGLVLYNGHIQNYIYNVPNKVHEYLDCGLKVISDPVIISLQKLQCPDIFFVDFRKLDSACITQVQNLLNTKNSPINKINNSLVEII